jgi:hypothetical protein
MDPIESGEADELATSIGTRWLLFSLVLFIAVGGVAVLGYGLGRGAWAVPPSIIATMPAPLVNWLQLDRLNPDTRTDKLQDYAFELIESQAKLGETILAVRLLHKPTGTAVSDAVIFAHRLDMAPDGMATMTAPLEALPTFESGTYRFKTDLMMEGSWQLSLAAKVQGETGTAQNQLLLKAVP